MPSPLTAARPKTLVACLKRVRDAHRIRRGYRAANASGSSAKISAAGVALALTVGAMIGVPTAATATASGITYIGVSTTHTSQVAAFAHAVGLPKVGIYNTYTSQAFQTQLDKAAVTGATPMISWTVPFAHSAVTNGSLDSYIDTQVAAAKAFGRPILVRLDWEMNGTWYPAYDRTGGTTPAQYAASWRHVQTRFSTAGNVRFVWCPNIGRPSGSTTDASAWYPGDAYVSWIGLDAYPDYGDKAPFTKTLAGTDGLNAIALYSAAHGKPMMLGEFARGAHSSGTDVPDTGSMINMIFDWAERYPATVRALVYFDIGTYHTIETHPQTASAFKSRSASSRYSTAPLS